jgi:hypothetical protein
MSTHRVIRLGVAVLSSMALVATGPVPVAVAEEPDATLTISTPGIPGGVAVDASGYVPFSSSRVRMM